MDDGRIGGEMTLEGIAKQLSEMHVEMRSEFASVRAQISTVDGKLTGKVESLEHKMKIEFEETRRVARLGFEAVEILREEVGRRFDETDRAHADQHSLLEAAVVSLRRT